MRFKKLLVHRCTLISEGVVIGRDPYGRDITDSKRDENVPCRFDQIKTVLSLDQYGADIIARNVLFFDSDIQIDMNSRIENVRDLEGNVILEGSFSIRDILPIYKGSELHHYEVEVQRK